MTSARDEILGRVRSALDGVDRTAPEAPAPRITPAADLVGHFADRVEHYRAVVERCAPADVEATVVAALARHLPGGSGTVVVPAGLSFDVAGAVVDTGLTALQLDRVDAVVTEAAVGVAETGTIVLDHGPGQGRRAVTLVPDRHVCVVRAEQVVPDVPDALARLDPLRPMTWISGPSATSDIELDRVEGVHGPRTLHVVVVDPA
ncbi:lactate utilization protein C [Nocardioides sp. Arc9.136]|uniref:LutC/YkgG family protein n=1 Tax=Nocardioides sp. Arc9.136 TaxID=2996826 RepID=UPI00266695AD|nr:lactate utilization protein C [Nocardioides sp. Arc9.136]WKN47433.1 lactate utilization protein C [Nocardioides sp. Arc9.136]